MFYKKLKDRISELETKLKAEQELNDKASENHQSVLKSLDDTMKIANNLRNDLEKVNSELDIYKREREELKSKCEEHADKDSLIQFLILKNNDLEKDILNLKYEKIDLLSKIQITQASYYYNPGVCSLMQTRI